MGIGSGMPSTLSLLQVGAAVLNLQSEVGLELSAFGFIPGFIYTGTIRWTPIPMASTLAGHCGEINLQKMPAQADRRQSRREAQGVGDER